MSLTSILDRVNFGDYGFDAVEFDERLEVGVHHLELFLQKSSSIRNLVDGSKLYGVLLTSVELKTKTPLIKVSLAMRRRGFISTGPRHPMT